MSRLRLGTRGSRLALVQAAAVARRLRDVHAGLTVELVEITTSGDRIRDVRLGPELGSAFFTKEIEDALLGGRIDVAVHSCKDLSATLPDGLALGAVPAREDPRDVLVSRGATLAALPPGARVATSSPRRKGFLAHARPDLRVEDQRGNVPTRLRAVDEWRVDAIVLACAGLRRLGLAERIVEILDPDLMLPAAGQGALAVQIRVDDERTGAVVSAVDDPRSHAAVAAERACLRRLQAGCQAPVGVLAQVDAGAVVVRAAMVTPERIVRARRSGAAVDPSAVGAAAAEELLGGLGIGSLRDLPWVREPSRPGDDG
jgi:hydroxymethylbilane synthase